MFSDLRASAFAWAKAIARVGSAVSSAARVRYPRLPPLAVRRASHLANHDSVRLIAR